MRDFNIKKFILHTIILITISTLISFFFQGLSLFSSWQKYYTTVGYGVLIGGAYWINNTTLGKLTGRRFNWFRNARKASMVTLWVFIVSGAIISLIIPYLYFKYVFNINQQHFWYTILFNSFIAFTIDLIFVSYFYSLYLVKALTESLQNEEKLKRETLIARYETLKNQVNPHFLFNSLNTLTGVVEKDGKKATAYIKKLSDIYRYVLEQKDNELIPVEKELEFINDFVYLEKIRHGEALQFRISIKSKKAFVAPHALQMLVENAVKHNIIADDNILHIELFEEENYFIVRNNYQKRKVISKKQPVGLENLVKRYEFLSDKKVLIEETETYFVVKLPVIHQQSPVT